MLSALQRVGLIYLSYNYNFTAIKHKANEKNPYHYIRGHGLTIRVMVDNKVRTFTLQMSTAMREIYHDRHKKPCRTSQLMYKVL